MGHSRADVVAASLRVLDAHGLEFCSMRRVAAALDVQPSALYHHVPNKQALLALMADEIVRDVAAPGGGVSLVAGARSPSEPVADPAGLCREMRRAMLAVRDGADVVATASAYRLGASAVEASLAKALHARFPGMGAGDAAESARTLLLFVFGHTQATQMQLQAQAFAALAAGRPADAAADPPGASRAELEASFDRGVAVILAGLAVFADRAPAAAPA